MGREKIAVIGAGQVGATTAQYIAEKELGDVVLVDIVEGMPQGKALDLSEGTPVEYCDVDLKGTNDYSDIKDSSIVVITAGIPRKPGMSREDLLLTNSKIVKGVVENVVKYAPDSIIIVVSNPLDIMTYLTYKLSNFPKNRVIGMAGVLDSTRFRYFIADALDVSVKDVHAMVLGSHGDSMVPLPRYATISGISLPDIMEADKISALVERTKKAGGEIVKLLKTGSAYYAPASSVTTMVKSIIKDENRILPASVKLEGEYSLSDVFIGVPIKLGKGGVKKVIELKLRSEELDMLKKSAEISKKNMQELDNLLVKV